MLFDTKHVTIDYKFFQNLGFAYIFSFGLVWFGFGFAKVIILGSSLNFQAWIHTFWYLTCHYWVNICPNSWFHLYLRLWFCFVWFGFGSKKCFDVTIKYCSLSTCLLIPNMSLLAHNLSNTMVLAIFLVLVWFSLVFCCLAVSVWSVIILRA